MTHDNFGREQGRLQMSRSRGAVTGILLILLGLWGLLIPLVGPYFNFAFTPDAFAFTAGRFWLEILPGLVTALGGLLLVTTANRAVAILGGYLAVAGGAWFVVGLTVAQHLPDGWGDVGTPLGSELTQTFEILSFFTGLGALIVFLAAHALGRVTVRSVRDVAVVQRDSELRAGDRVGTDSYRERDLADRDLADRQDVRGRDDLADRDRDASRDRDVVVRRDGDPVGRLDEPGDGDLVDRDGVRDRGLTDRDRDRDRDLTDRDGVRDRDLTDRDGVRDGELADRDGVHDRDLTDRDDVRDVEQRDVDPVSREDAPVVVDPPDNAGGSTRVPRE